MSNLLLSHEAQQVTLLGVDALGVELGVAEPGEPVVEQIQLDPFLVQCQVERLEVKVRHGLVLGRGRAGGNVGSAQWLRRCQRAGGGQDSGSSRSESKEGLRQHFVNR